MFFLQKMMVFSLLAGECLLLREFIRKQDMEYYKLLQATDKRFLLLPAALCFLPCNSGKDMLVFFLTGMLFVIGYMDWKTMEVYQILLLQLLVKVLAASIFTGISSSAYVYGFMLLLMGKIGVFGWADVYVYGITLGIIHLCGGSVFYDSIVVFFCSQVCFLLYAIGDGLWQKRKRRDIWHRKMPMIPSIVVVVYLYVMFRGGI